MKLGRFVVDTHVHAQRFAAGKAVREYTQQPGLRPGAQARGKWEQLSDVMRNNMLPYDISARLISDMECYGIDMCVLLPAFSMTDELNRQIVERYPDRFVAECDGSDYTQKAMRGEIKWSIEGICEELDRLLSTGAFVGIGETSPCVPVPWDLYHPPSQEQVITNMLAILEVARKHKVPARVHTGCPMGYDLPYTSNNSGPINYNPLLVHDLASAFPDVPIIFAHGGLQGWWSEKLQEDCLQVAAAHSNVYLETGLWWTELYERALVDPNIGPEKLIWGTDWGASMGFHSQPGRYPPSYPVQLRSKGPVTYQVDFWGWSLREVGRLRIPQDDLNLILGGNAAFLYHLPVKHTRLFRPRELR
jgi:predicted TIM-barrel fold metal-dependent hydrolase